MLLVFLALGRAEPDISVASGYSCSLVVTPFTPAIPESASIPIVKWDPVSGSTIAMWDDSTDTEQPLQLVNQAGISANLTCDESRYVALGYVDGDDRLDAVLRCTDPYVGFVLVPDVTGETPAESEHNIEVVLETNTYFFGLLPVQPSSTQHLYISDAFTWFTLDLIAGEIAGYPLPNDEEGFIACYAEDVNGDGWHDAVCSGETEGVLYVAPGASTGRFGAFAILDGNTAGPDGSRVLHGTSEVVSVGSELWLLSKNLYASPGGVELTLCNMSRGMPPSFVECRHIYPSAALTTNNVVAHLGATGDIVLTGLMLSTMERHYYVWKRGEDGWVGDTEEELMIRIAQTNPLTFQGQQPNGTYVFVGMTHIVSLSPCTGPTTSGTMGGDTSEPSTASTLASVTESAGDLPATASPGSSTDDTVLLVIVVLACVCAYVACFAAWLRYEHRRAVQRGKELDAASAGPVESASSKHYASLVHGYRRVRSRNARKNTVPRSASTNSAGNVSSVYGEVTLSELDLQSADLPGYGAVVPPTLFSGSDGALEYSDVYATAESGYREIALKNPQYGPVQLPSGAITTGYSTGELGVSASEYEDLQLRGERTAAYGPMTGG